MRAALLLALCLAPAAAALQEPQPPAAPQPPLVVGLALGGGSARGLAHVGVLQVLEEHGIPVDRIVGTSMGACVGSLYASGHSAAEVGAIAHGIDWSQIFRGRAERRHEPVAWRVDDVPAIATLGVRRGRLLAPSAAFSDYRIGRVLFEHLAGPGLLAGGDFDRLPIPFRAVATDLRTGERVVLGSGDLPRSVRASMSLPVVFPPVELDGRLLVDGGLVDNLPAGVARDLGADVVIAVDVGAPPREISEDAGVLEVVGRLTEFMMTRGNYGFARPPDLRIRPDLTSFDADDFERHDEVIAAGRAAALAALPQIEALLAGRRREAGARPARALVAGRLTQVEFRGLERVRESLLRRRLGVSAGDPFELAAALSGLDAIWASNLFSTAWLELVAGPEAGLALVASVRERPVTRIGVGLSYNESDDVRGFLRLRNGNLLGLGERLDLLARFDSGQARLDASLASVALGGSAVGYRLGLRVSEDKPQVYDDEGNSIGRTRFRQQLFGASLERSIGSFALLGAGLQGGHAEIDERSGIPFAPRSDTVVKGVARLVTDTLDDRFFSTRGVRLDLRADHTLAGLGSELDYGRAWARLDAFVPVGARGLFEVHAFGGLAGSQTPEYDFFQIGGPELVPGRGRQELWGRWAGAAGIGLGVRLGPSWRLVARAGAGNAWDRKEDMTLADLRAGGSLGAAHSTRLGPVSVDFGLGGGKLQVHVTLGFQ